MCLFPRSNKSLQTQQLITAETYCPRGQEFRVRVLVTLSPPRGSGGGSALCLSLGLQQLRLTPAPVCLRPALHSYKNT